MTSPQVLDGAQVLATADVSARPRTGRTLHVRDGDSANGQIARLAICQYEDDGGIYLFYCDESWTVITDTLHDSFDAALGQAQFEFEGILFVRRPEAS